MLVEKDPDATLDYVFDWSVWLDDTDSISTDTITVTGGLTVESHSHTTSAVTVWLSGGDPGTQTVSCLITTADGRIDERTMNIRVRDR